MKLKRGMKHSRKVQGPKKIYHLSFEDNDGHGKDSAVNFFVRSVAKYLKCAYVEQIINYRKDSIQFALNKLKDLKGSSSTILWISCHGGDDGEMILKKMPREQRYLPLDEWKDALHDSGFLGVILNACNLGAHITLKDVQGWSCQWAMGSDVSADWYTSMTAITKALEYAYLSAAECNDHEKEILKVRQKIKGFEAQVDHGVKYDWIRQKGKADRPYTSIFNENGLRIVTGSNVWKAG